MLRRSIPADLSERRRPGTLGLGSSDGGVRSGVYCGAAMAAIATGDVAAFVGIAAIAAVGADGDPADEGVVAEIAGPAAGVGPDIEADIGGRKGGLFLHLDGAAVAAAGGFVVAIGGAIGCPGIEGDEPQLLVSFRARVSRNVDRCGVQVPEQVIGASCACLTVLRGRLRMVIGTPMARIIVAAVRLDDGAVDAARLGGEVNRQRQRPAGGR